MSCHVSIYGTLACAVEDTHRTYDVLFSYQTGDGCNSCLPVTEALRDEDPCQALTDLAQDTHIDLILSQHTEAVLGESEVSSKPYNDGGQKDDGTCLLDEGPATLPHAAQYRTYGRPMVSGKLHNERSGIALEDLGLLQDNTGADDCCDSQEVCGRSNPCCAAEDSTCYHGDERKLSTTRNKCGSHNRHLTVSVVLDGTGSHDTGNTTSGTDQHRNEGFTGQTELTEDTVHDECDTCHVTTGLQECQEDEQYQHLGYETKHCTDTGYNTVKDQSFQPVGTSDRIQTGL